LKNPDERSSGFFISIPSCSRDEPVVHDPFRFSVRWFDYQHTPWYIAITKINSCQKT